MAQLPKERTRLRAVDPHYCRHPKLIQIWRYKRFPDKTFCKCLVCGREMVMQTGIVSSATVTAPPRATRQGSNLRSV
jgi:hypothetical protein